MLTSRTPSNERLPAYARLWLVLAGCGLLVLLATAASLRPDPRGFGTHQQLGLPPCSLKQWTGYRCPSCGMTTSWAYLVRGHAIRAVQANAGGFVLGLLALVGGAWALASGLRGDWLGRPPGPRMTSWICLAVVAITLLDWSLRILLGH